MTTKTRNEGGDCAARYLLEALCSENASNRLQAALSMGTAPDPAYVEALVERCGVEDDFFVRDMLTWALVRHPVGLVMPLLTDELCSESAQARSQALHTLSKVGDPAVWPNVPSTLLHDPDEEVARAAWRAGVALAREEERTRLVTELVSELGRGDWEVQRSLSRALVELGEDFVEGALRIAASSREQRIRAHARATARLLRDPDAGFALDPGDLAEVFDEPAAAKGTGSAHQGLREAPAC